MQPYELCKSSSKSLTKNADFVVTYERAFWAQPLVDKAQCHNMGFVYPHKNILTFYEVTYETGSFCRVIIEDYVFSILCERH